MMRLYYVRDETGYHIADDQVGYFAGGPTFDELCARVAESAHAEGWDGWLVAPMLSRSWKVCWP